MTALMIIEARGEAVMLDEAVASHFAVTTSALNQAVSRNPKKFSDRHCFRLSEEEWKGLKSQSVIANSGRGGRRSPPMAYTMLGIARLATVLNSEEALEATDLILETFIDVRRQVAQGKQTAIIESPSRLIDEDHHDDHEQRKQFRAKLTKAMNGLLDTVIDMRTGGTIREVTGTMSADALQNLRERLRRKGLENEKLEAELQLILAQAELVAAQVRETDEKTGEIALRNLETRIRLVRELSELERQLTPPALVSMLSQLDQPKGVPALPKPTKKKDD